MVPLRLWEGHLPSPDGGVVRGGGGDVGFGGGEDVGFGGGLLVLFL